MAESHDLPPVFPNQIEVAEQVDRLFTWSDGVVRGILNRVVEYERDNAITRI